MNCDPDGCSLTISKAAVAAVIEEKPFIEGFNIVASILIPATGP